MKIEIATHVDPPHVNGYAVATKKFIAIIKTNDDKEVCRGESMAYGYQIASMEQGTSKIAVKAALDLLQKMLENATKVAVDAGLL